MTDYENPRWIKVLLAIAIFTGVTAMAGYVILAIRIAQLNCK